MYIFKKYLSFLNGNNFIPNNKIFLINKILRQTRFVGFTVFFNWHPLHNILLYRKNVIREQATSYVRPRMDPIKNRKEWQLT